MTEPGPDLLAWRLLRGTDLVHAVLTCRWHAVADDLIGGWAVMPTPDPPSAGYPQIGVFLSREIAEHIARQHNTALEDTWTAPT